MAHIASEMALPPNITFPHSDTRLNQHIIKSRPVPLNRVALTNSTQLKIPQSYQEALEWLCPPSTRVELSLGHDYEDMDSTTPSSSKPRSEDPSKYPPQAPSALIACALDEQIGTWRAASPMDRGNSGEGTASAATMTTCAAPGLDKELPPTPVFTPIDSLEEHDFDGDSTEPDSETEKVTFAALTPKSSLVSLNDSILTNETPTVHVAKAINFKTIKGSKGVKDMLQLVPGKPGSMNGLSEAPVAERVVMVTVEKNGSPLPRRPIRKPSRHDLRGFNALSQKGKSRVADTEIARQAVASSGVLQEPAQLPQMDDPARVASTSPLQQDDGIRRSSKYDCGPTVRYSVDAREVIMGGHDRRSVSAASVYKGAIRDSTSSIKSAKPSMKTGKSENEKGAPKQAFRNIVVQLKTPSAPTGGMRGGRSVSDFGASGPNIKPQDAKKGGQPATMSRFSRPTAASAAREAVSKSTVKLAKHSSPKDGADQSTKHPTSTSRSESKVPRPTCASLPNDNSVTTVEQPSRGFKSRISSLLPSRRRSEPPATNRPNSYSPILNRHSSLAQSVGASSAQASVHRQPNIVSNQFVPEPTDRLDRARDRAARPTTYALVNRVPLLTNATRSNTSATLRRNQVRGGDEEPPTPPRSRSGPGAHYEGIGPGAAAGDMGDAVDAPLRDAETHLDLVIHRTRQVTDRAFRDQSIRLIEELGSAIQVTRQLHMAAIAQARTNAGIAATISRLTVDVATVVAIAN
ncbi:uncharacterized protein BP5553_02362 [Venustampulla echinocandica]|uniref:Uncharacterized protein n=1 Tax=Venustampulla echinocandica TaxID=2656787 RepID=A0A370U3R0_9HELO|nr:uncharacterized protein BP5553_02362 [Venustampulla echinocandica]RDL42383.1 hypothetical protein BP5553_02362 [Venustampulla echinocandica]